MTIDDITSDITKRAEELRRRFSDIADVKSLTLSSLQCDRSTYPIAEGTARLVDTGAESIRDLADLVWTMAIMLKALADEQGAGNDR